MQVVKQEACRGISMLWDVGTVLALVASLASFILHKYYGFYEISDNFVTFIIKSN